MPVTGRAVGGTGRNRVYALIVLLAALLVSGVEVRAGEYLVYVGTYTGAGSQGIYAYRLDPASGTGRPLGLAVATDNPSFLASDPEGRFLYAVNELDTFRNEPTGAVSVFAIDPTSGRLRLLQQVSSLGAGPAHLSLDRTGRHLLVANYGGGSVVVFPIGDDGRLGRRSAFVQDVGSSVNPERQAGPHAHFIQTTLDDRFAIVADLGLDKLLVHRFDAATGSLTPADQAFVAMDPGAGPRHVALAPSGRFVYVVNELASTVTVLTYESGPGTLRSIQTVPTLPPGFAGESSAAEIVVDAQGKSLYASNRGHDSIVVFSIDPDDGSLKPLEWIPSGGRTPRSFAIDPTGRWLLAANQGSDAVSLLRIDPKTGRLTPSDQTLAVVSPVCVHVVSFDKVGEGGP